MDVMKKFHIPQDRYSGEILTWCSANFGKPMPTGRARWDTYQHTVFNSDNSRFVNGRMFMFYNDVDAMAFKLRWL